MIGSQVQGDWRRQLSRRLRLTLAELAALMPVSGAVVSARRDPDGPFEVVAEVRADDAPQQPPSPDLVLSHAALAWLEANHRELVLEVRRGYRESELYRPLIAHGIPAAVLCPIFYVDELSGVIVFTTSRRTCTTERQLRMIRILVPKLVELVPPPMTDGWHVEEPTVETARGSAAPPQPAQTAEHSLRAELVPPREAGPVESAGSPPVEAPASEGSSRRSAESIRLEADALGRVEDWSGEAERAFGWSRDEVIGSFLTLFYRDKHRHLLDPTLRDELLREGRFEGRAICYSRDGLPVTCRITLEELRDAGGRTTGFRGSFRIVKPETLLPREQIEFGFARLYAFTNPVKP
jgi:PAS domain S-box-containing protein